MYGTGQNRLSSFQIGYEAISYQIIQLIKIFRSACMLSTLVKSGKLKASRTVWKRLRVRRLKKFQSGKSKAEFEEFENEFKDDPAFEECENEFKDDHAFKEFKKTVMSSKTKKIPIWKVEDRSKSLKMTTSSISEMCLWSTSQKNSNPENRRPVEFEEFENEFKDDPAFEEFEEDKEFQRRLHFIFNFIRINEKSNSQLKISKTA